MSIHQFPASRIVRHECEQRQGMTPLALFFFPARLWIDCWSRWMDLMIAAEPDVKVTFHFGGIDRNRTRS